MPRGLRPDRKNLGAVELLQGQDLAGNGPKYRSRTPVVVEGVDPKARQAVNFKREVNLQKLFIVLALRIVHDVVHHGVHLLVVQRSTLMRRTSPCTRIIGGRPADRCRSDALFLTLNASNWVMSTKPLRLFVTLRQL
jgi:hypothetical protein